MAVRIGWRSCHHAARRTRAGEPTTGLQLPNLQNLWVSQNSMLSGETWLDMLSGADTPVAWRSPAGPVKVAARAPQGLP